MNRPLAAAAAMIVALGALPPAFAAGNLGYVETQRVFQQYKAAQQAQSRFRHEAQSYQEELAADQRKLEEARKAGKSADEINRMQRRFEEELKPKKTRVEGLDRELSGKIKHQIENVIGEVAKSKGIATVLDKQVVLYGGIDLTDDVVRRLNK